MKNSRLEDRYFTWLYRQTASVNVKDPSKTHWELLRQFHAKEFVWIVANDDNRAADGVSLRVDFVDEELEHGWAEVDDEWYNMGCSMLELLIGLSRNLAFEGGGEPYTWFWELVENLGLKEHTDKNPGSREHVSDVLDTVIWRTYAPDGTGGLFPLKDPLSRSRGNDQRQIELWYQMNAYLLERE